MKTIFNITPERIVPLAELEMAEVFVLDEYEIEAETKEEALEEFYWHAPIMNHQHFQVRVYERMA